MAAYCIGIIPKIEFPTFLNRLAAIFTIHYWSVFTTLSIMRVRKHRMHLVYADSFNIGMAFLIFLSKSHLHILKEFPRYSKHYI